MMMHHFWAFPDWVLDENTYWGVLNGNQSLEFYIGNFGKICVSMYVFITGYAIYVNSDKYIFLKDRLFRILRFLFNYWVFAFGFIVIGFIIGEPLPDIEHFIFNLFGYDTGVFDYGKGYMCVTMAWYVKFYISAMLILPIFLIHTHKSFIVDILIAVLSFRVLLFAFDYTSLVSSFIINQTIDTFIEYMPVLLVGYYVAEYKIFERVNNFLSYKKIIKIFLAIFVCCLVAYARVNIVYFKGFFLDIFYAPIFIFGLIIIYNECAKISYFKQVEQLLILIGSQSLNLWFIHGLFFTPHRTLQGIAYWPKLSILILVWVFVLLLPVCVLISKSQNKVWGYLGVVPKIFTSR